MIVGSACGEGDEQGKQPSFFDEPKSLTRCSKRSKDVMLAPRTFLIDFGLFESLFSELLNKFVA